jgi:HEPN domain-containing protein
MKLTLEESYMILEHRYKDAAYNSVEDAEALLEIAKTFTTLVKEYVDQVKEAEK